MSKHKVKKQPKAGKSTNKPVNNSKQTIINAASVVLFAVVAYVVLTVWYGNYMRRLESLSLFMPTQMFFRDCMAIPGGLVTWLSIYLNQYLYHPAIGALIVTLLLAAIQVLSIRAFKVNGPWKPAVVIIPTLLLLGFTNLGYLIFTLRPAGYALSPMIGILISLCLYLCYSKIGNLIARIVVILIYVVIGYPYLGFYALFTATMCALSCILDKTSITKKLTLILVAAAAVAIVPNLWFTYIGKNLMESKIYLSGLPYFYKSEYGWWALYASIFILLIIGAIFSHLKNTANNALSKKSPAIQYAIWCASIVCIFTFKYNDRNFMLTLDLNRALWDQDWGKAISLSKEMDKTPTRVNTVLPYLALLNTGQSADMMFALPYGWETYNTSRDTRPMHDSEGALISYHLGLINYAYRWGMEYNIGQGLSVERLKILTKCALIKYELKLAKTYLEILYNMPNHRTWAKKYLHYVSNPLEMNGDAEIWSIKQRMYDQSQFINDGGAYEAYIWPLLSKAQTSNQAQTELSMQAALINRDLDSFMAKLPQYASTATRMPRYYQEAALLWSFLNNKPAPIKIDPQVETRHKMFLNQFRRYNKEQAEEQRTAMSPSFGDTYWYYFIFTEDKPFI